MRHIESSIACLLLLALLHASIRSTACGREDFLAQQRAISAIKRVGGLVERYEDRSGTRGLSVRLDYVPPPLPGMDPGAARFKWDAPIDSELKHLESVPHLKRLDLQVDGTRISGAALEQLRGLRELQSLSLRFYPQVVTPAKGDEPSVSGLKYIRGLERLTSLHIDLWDRSGAALRDIKDLPRLETLSLTGSEIADADLDFLRGLKSLEDLSLTSPRLTDKALVRVQELTHLRVLSLEYCPGVTVKAIKGLRQALPRTRIFAPIR